MDAEDLLLREFLGIRTAAETDAAARWIRSQQRDDGTWANFHGGPADLSTTVEAYVALRLAGDAPDAPHMAAAAELDPRPAAASRRTRVFTRIWLALFGQWSWDDLPVMPPELIYLPPGSRSTSTTGRCWARQTIVPLTIVGTLRARSGRCRSASTSCAPAAATAAGAASGCAAGRLSSSALDQGAAPSTTRLAAQPLRRLRRAAMRRRAEWIIARQEADGCWGGIQPPWVYSLLALHLLGYPLDHPVMRARARRAWTASLIREETPGRPGPPAGGLPVAGLGHRAWR